MFEQCVLGILQPLAWGSCLSDWTHIFIFRTLPSLCLLLPRLCPSSANSWYLLCNHFGTGNFITVFLKMFCPPFLKCACCILYSFWKHVWEFFLIHTLFFTLSINPHCSSQHQTAHYGTPFIYSLASSHHFSAWFSPFIPSFSNCLSHMKLFMLSDGHNLSERSSLGKPLRSRHLWHLDVQLSFFHSETF